MTASADNYFHDLCDNLGFVLIAVDRDLNIRFLNRQATQHFEGSTEDGAARCVKDIFHGPQGEDIRRLLEETIETKTAGETEVKCERDEGERKILIFIASPIIDSSGECVGASASMRDISLRKRLSKELALSRRMAALGNMAGAIAHHFNNILGGMLTSIDYVLPSDSPRELRRTLRLLAQAIGRATRITRQLEAFAESEHDKAEWAELNDVMQGFIDQLRPQAEEAGINLDTDIAEVTSEPFEAHRLMPALESLAHNAFDAMTAGGTLTIRMVQDGDEAVITIADTGCGIPEDVLDRVFEPFFTTKGELGGGATDNIGLGLAAVHGLVAELGGTIRLASRVGEGTTAEVRLPLRRDRKGHPDGVVHTAGRSGPE
ncbi:MAG: PAS domain-containing protein [Phycisphaerae bacterium]|nr:PAS domain-containing protein [Phycisphaerae bacterium]